MGHTTHLRHHSQGTRLNSMYQSLQKVNEAITLNSVLFNVLRLMQYGYKVYISLTGLRRWAIPYSIAFTKGILVSFFSSA